MTIAGTSEWIGIDWPPDGLEQVGACPVCSGTSRTKLYDNLTDEIFKCAPGKWTLWLCEGCSSAYIDPRPSQETIHLAYRKYYTHRPGPSRQPPPPSLSRLVRRRLANGYRNFHYGTKYSDAWHVGRLISFLPPNMREIVDAEFRYLPPKSKNTQRRVLDIGCGNGDFLVNAHTAGWMVFGCDPDPNAVSTAGQAGLDVRQGNAEVWLDHEEFFDVVTISHVIEHVPDPKKLLQTTFRLLRPGGQLYIDTPNIDALGHKLYERFWRGLDPPRHLVLFNWKSLRFLLEQSGFVAMTARRRIHVFTDFSRKSALVQAELHYGSKQDNLSLHLPSMMDKIRARITHNRSEFVTLTCDRTPTCA